jgi:hypothetical protein
VSLNWSLAESPNKEKCLSKEEWPNTEAIIFEAMAVGIGSITEKSWQEFYLRSCLFRRSIKAEEFSPADIKLRIGLHTNISRESQSAWLKRLWLNHTSRMKRVVALRDDNPDLDSITKKR